MKVKHFVYAALILGIAYLIYYRINQNSAKTNQGVKPAPLEVSAVVLEPVTFENKIALTGTIEANEQVDVRSEISGTVSQIGFEEGSFVQKGQVLVKVDDSELRAQLSRAETQQNLASENERRAGLLLEKEAISREEYDIASADFRSAKAQTQLIRAQMAKTSVRAPFSGRIGLRHISPGAYVTAQTPIARLVNAQQVKITFSLPEKYASQMKPGSEIEFEVAGQSDVFLARIYALEPEVSVSTRTLTLRALADNPQHKLIPGTFAKVSLVLDEVKDALIVPTEAVIPVQNGKKVFVYKNGKAQEVMVETDVRTATDIQVLSGLKAGDTVLTTGVLSLRNGADVRVKLVKEKTS